MGYGPLGQLVRVLVAWQSGVCFRLGSMELGLGSRREGWRMELDTGWDPEYSTGDHWGSSYSFKMNMAASGGGGVSPSGSEERDVGSEEGANWEAAGKARINWVFLMMTLQGWTCSEMKFLEDSGWLMISPPSLVCWLSSFWPIFFLYFLLILPEQY